MYVQAQIVKYVTLVIGRWCKLPESNLPTSFRGTQKFTFIAHHGLQHHNTHTHVRLLGPCFKTGRIDAYTQLQQHLRQLQHRDITVSEETYLHDANFLDQTPELRFSSCTLQCRNIATIHNQKTQNISTIPF